ncbi:MAG: DUF1761 domain-containing protein [Patescibacteria group bacterium]|jgi:hypothetical protein
MIPVINYAAVIVAMLSSMVLGFLWYGPLFGKPWMAIMGYSKDSMDKAKNKGMTMNYIIMAIGSLLTAFVLAHALEFASVYTKTFGISAGLMAAFWNWLGFMAPIHAADQLWGGKPWKLFLITAGYSLVSMGIMGVILALWK